MHPPAPLDPDVLMETAQTVALTANATGDPLYPVLFLVDHDGLLTMETWLASTDELFMSAIDRRGRYQAAAFICEMWLKRVRPGEPIPTGSPSELAAAGDATVVDGLVVSTTTADGEDHYRSCIMTRGDDGNFTFTDRVSSDEAEVVAIGRVGQALHLLVGRR